MNKSFTSFTKFLIIIFTFIVSINTVYSQEKGGVSGKILDKGTGEPLIGANLIIDNSLIGAATDIDGKFSIQNIPVGKHKYKASYIGYQAVEGEISVFANKSTTIEIELDYKIIEGEVVVVTGQVEGQIGAINQQLSSNTISNVVSKSRIEELPDVNAAESIGRLPGVSINRSGGEANKVSIRGLSPKYNAVSVNGVRLPSNSGTDRSVDLSLISSNMLAGIEVKKANTADMDADALGGSIDLRLKEAAKGLKFNINAQGGYNKMLKDWGNYNIYGNISNRFFDDKLGVIFGFNGDKYNRSVDQYSGSYIRRDTPSGETQNIISNISTRDVYTIRDRIGASIVLDYQLSNGKLTSNAFYNKLSWDQLRREQRYDLANNRHYFNFRDNGGSTDIYTTSLGIEQDFGIFKYDLTAALTGSETKAPGEREFNFTREGGAFIGAIGVNTNPEDIPALTVYDSTRLGLQDIYQYETSRNEKQSNISLNFEVPYEYSNYISGYLKAGVKFKWLTRDNNQDQYGRNGLYYGNGSGPNQYLSVLGDRMPGWDVDGLVGQYGVLPLSLFLDDYSRDNFLDNKYPLGYTANFDMLHQLYEAMNMVTDSSGAQLEDIPIGSLANDYNGIEHYQAAYLMTEMKIGKYLTFIPGVRFENDYSKYTAYLFREVTINNRPAPPQDLDTITSVRQNDFILPMIHLNVDPYDWLKIRMAYTQTLTRPDFNMYAPITRINAQNNYMRAANTKLKPAVSTNYDLSVSVYENHVGLFTVSGFYKNVKDLIFQYNYPIHPDIPVFDGFTIPDNWTKSVKYGADTYLNNKNHAFYSGLELDWQTNFWYVPFLQGLVLNVNYTRVFSEMDKQQFRLRKSDRRKPGGGPPRYYYEVLDTVRSSRLPDQPAHIANITLGYDYKDFSARLSFLYQTNKVTYIDSNEELDQFSGEYSRWDLTLQQKFMENLQFFMNFTNLNNRPDENFRGLSKNNPTYIEYYGLTVDFGIRYKL